MHESVSSPGDRPALARVLRRLQSGSKKTDVLPLDVRDLRLNIAGQNLLDGLDLELAGNGISVVMGANGAGKSLLLRCLHGLIVPTSGRISWGGITMSPEVRRRQAMVFQRPVLLRRTVSGNVRFAQKAQQIEDDGAIHALLEAVRLDEIADRPARKLSGGEQQRLALARALATRPDVLFLDEPTANLDPASTRIIEDLVTAVSEQGVKVVFVTHNIHQAQRLADDLVFLSAGAVCEHRPASEFFAAPRSPQAEAYLTGRLPEI